MTRNTLRVDDNINPDVKVGDRVKLTNAETLTHMAYQHDFDLLRKYPTLGINKSLEDVVGRVTHTGITNFIVQRENKFVAYAQDIIVNVSGQMFRTSSGAVRVIKKPEQILKEKIKEAESQRDAVIARNGTMGELGQVENVIDLYTDLLDEIRNHK